jgi:uncharacterized integral membrane protein
MFRKIVTLVVVLPLAAIIIAFAVANRQTVTVSFDPFSAASPAYAATLPLFILIFVLVILGVIVGGIAAWLRQAKWRRTARQLDHDVRLLHQELAALRGRIQETPASSQQASSPAPKLVIPPPAA